MDQTPHLWLFFILVFGVVLLPGLDMACVLANALIGGRRAGIMATAGIIAGGIFHVLMGALGVMAILSLWPALFNALLLAGAVYIAWIGVSLLRSDAALGDVPVQSPRPAATIFVQGMLTSLLNPKAYLFMLAIFPQFFKPAQGALWRQALLLWIIIALTQLLIYGGLAMTGGSVRGWLAARPRANTGLARAVGSILVLSALYTAWAGWRAS